MIAVGPIVMSFVLGRVFNVGNINFHKNLCVIIEEFASSLFINFPMSGSQSHLRQYRFVRLYFRGGILPSEDTISKATHESGVESILGLQASHHSIGNTLDLIVISTGLHNKVIKMWAGKIKCYHSRSNDVDYYELFYPLKTFSGSQK